MNINNLFIKFSFCFYPTHSFWPTGAVLASTLMFGLGHAYQGAAGIVRTGIVGLLCAGAYVATGNLLAPMLLHVVIDATSGMVAYLALRPVTAVGGLLA